MHVLPNPVTCEQTSNACKFHIIQHFHDSIKRSPAHQKLYTHSIPLLFLHTMCLRYQRLILATFNWSSIFGT